MRQSHFSRCFCGNEAIQIEASNPFFWAQEQFGSLVSHQLSSCDWLPATVSLNRIVPVVKLAPISSPYFFRRHFFSAELNFDQTEILTDQSGKSGIWLWWQTGHFTTPHSHFLPTVCWLPCHYFFMCHLLGCTAPVHARARPIFTTLRKVANSDLNWRAIFLSHSFAVSEETATVVVPYT